ncbi:unnamed protein product [Phytomonas sp. Hart1]|nr:unnamed protein product [Phytomonas sp. Hart1]|eukprot:CCW70498.1 unnamed protein product [Phytomonas sp. isolate Hart1]
MAHSPCSSDASTFKILITTDNHIGFAERDPRRGDDSFTTFEEVLRAARVEHEVDFALLGGDLFHENKPSLGCLVRTSSLMRKYVLGDRPVRFSFLSDPAKNFPTHALPLANFQDPNLNVALPIFAIHGNHDDPVGGTSALDVLSTGGYLNYFGHVSSLECIVVEPILLQKGSTFIALYGLGNVRDERLHRCFRHKKVHFVRPKPLPGRTWFNILLLHQNRGVRGVLSKSGIFEHMLSGLGFDLVIWGNEHEQMMVPQPSQGFDIVQPGSTILTSLSGQECNPKQYGILEVRNASYRLTPFPLRSMRPVVRRTVVLAKDNPRGRTLDSVEEFLRSVVDEMLGEAEDQISHIPDDILTFHPNIKFPLMRLFVDFTDVESAPFPQPNLNRFGQQYIDVVANPGELLRPIRIKPPTSGVAGKPRARGAGNSAGDLGDWVVPVAPQLGILDIRAKVAEVFNQGAKDACSLLSEPEVSSAVYAFAEKGERDAIDERIMELLNTSQKIVWRKLGNGDSEAILKPDVIAAEVELYKREMNQRYARTLRTEAEEKEDAAAREGGDTGDLRNFSRDHPNDEGPSAMDEYLDDEDAEEQRRTEQRSRYELFNSAAPTTTTMAASAFDGNIGQALDLVMQSKQRKVNDGDGDWGGFGVDRARPPGGLIPPGKHATEEAALEDLEELPSDGLDRVFPYSTSVHTAMNGDLSDKLGESILSVSQVGDLPYSPASTKRPRNERKEREGEPGYGDGADNVVSLSDNEDNISQMDLGIPPAYAAGRTTDPKGTLPKKMNKKTAPGSTKTSTTRRRGGRLGESSSDAEQQSQPRRKRSTAAAAPAFGMPMLNLVYHQAPANAKDEKGGGVSLNTKTPSNPAPGMPAAPKSAERPMLNLLSKWSSQS